MQDLRKSGGVGACHDRNSAGSLDNVEQTVLIERVPQNRHKFRITDIIKRKQVRISDKQSVSLYRRIRHGHSRQRFPDLGEHIPQRFDLDLPVPHWAKARHERSLVPGENHVEDIP